MSHEHQSRLWLLLGHRLRQGPKQQPMLAPCGCAVLSGWHDCYDSEALWHKHGYSWWPKPVESTLCLMISGTLDINTDLGCSRIGPWTMAWPSGAAVAQMTPWPQWQPGPQTPTGCSLDPGHPCDLWWHHKIWTSQILTVIGPHTQTWSSVATKARMSPEPLVAVQVIQIGMDPTAVWP